MTKLKFILTILFVCIIFLGSCGNNDDEKTKDLHLGDTTLLKINESVTFLSDKNKNDSVTISFDKVLNDGRCHLSQCYVCYGSRADIEVSMRYQNNIYAIPFSILGCIDGDANICKDTLGYRIHILQLTPYPDIEPINPSDYSIKLEVTKL